MCNIYNPEMCDSRQSLLWEYRVVSHKVITERGVDVWNEIHEVYFDKQGTPVLYDNATPSGLTVRDVAFDLSYMRDALQKPVLFYDDAEAKFIERTSTGLDL